MKSFSLYSLIVLLGSLLIWSGCQEKYEMGDLITPTNVQLTYEIVGADDENPNGDGSGVVNFIASANNAITYNFDFGDGRDNQISANGKTTHQFSQTGVNAYNVKVYAVGTGGISSSTATQLEVFSSFADPEAVQFLTGGSSRTWYWAADQPGHLGLGPNDKVYEDGEHTYDAWYAAAPWEKSESSLYQCECVFSLDGEQVKFEQINPTGEAFIQGLYSESLGLGEEGSYPWPIEGIKNVSLSPSSSIATIDGEYRGTSFIISDEGFMGFYAGTFEYEIIEITDNILTVRLGQANEPEFAWYHVFTTTKPVQE